MLGTVVAYVDDVLVGIFFVLKYVCCDPTISHVLNEQGTGYEHIFSSVQTFNID